MNKLVHISNGGVMSTAIKLCSNLFKNNGVRLVSKDHNLVLEAMGLNKLLKGINLPQGAISADIVSIERGFGSESVKIISFKNSDGKLVQRIEKLFSKKGKALSKVSDYTHEKNPQGNINLTLIDRQTSDSSGAVSRAFENIRVVHTPIESYSAKPTVIRTTFNQKYITSSKVKAEESSLFGRFQNGKEPQVLNVSNQRCHDDSIVRVKRQQTGLAPEKIAELAKDRYLPIRLAPVEDFLNTLRHYVYKKQGIVRANVESHFSDNLEYDIANNRGVLGRSFYDNDRNFHIKLNKKAFGVQTKGRLLNTFNHEARHCRQSIFEEQLDYTRNGLSFNPNVRQRQLLFGELTSLKQITLAEKLKQARGGGSSDINPQGYLSNFREVNARSVGKKAQAEYENLGINLADTFNLSKLQAGLGY